MKNKNAKNEELLDKMLVEAKIMRKTREKKQLKLWKEMLKQLPGCSDAWFQIKSIVATAEFMRDHYNEFEIGGFGQDDAPLVVQMLKNLCLDYNHQKPEAGWMLNTVLGMSEYGVSTLQATRILHCALQVGVLREWFWEEDENAMFVPSMLDTPITGEIAEDLVKEYKNALIECSVLDCDLLAVDVFRDFLKKYIKDMPEDKPHGEIEEDIFPGDLGMP